MAMAEAGESRAVVSHVSGAVFVGGRLVADRVDLYGQRDRARAVRERTSDDWWRRAADLLDADSPYATGGPVGPGVDFFAWEGHDAIPPDVRQAIQEDAYEAAREVILAGISDHLRRMTPAAAAVSYSGSSKAPQP